MPKIPQPKPLGQEGTISFKLTPTQNSKDRLYLIDIGAESQKDRITLVAIKNQEEPRQLALEIYNTEGNFLNTSKVFPDFKIGSSFGIELVWSTAKHKVAVFVATKLFLSIDDTRIKFSNLGNAISYGEDIKGDNRTEMTAEY